MQGGFEQFRETFFEETDDHFALLNESLMALENDPSDRGWIDTAFRILHTVKSSAASVGFPRLAELSHQAEDVVEAMRNGDAEAGRKWIDILFEVLDGFRAFTELARLGRESEADFSGVLERLRTHREGFVREGADARMSGDASAAGPFPALTGSELDVLLSMTGEPKHIFRILAEIDPSEPVKWLRAELLCTRLQKHGCLLRSSPEKEVWKSASFDGRLEFLLASAETEELLASATRMNLIKYFRILPVDHSAAEAVAPPMDIAAGPKADAAAAVSTDSRSRLTQTDTVRVAVKKLDDLLHRVSELVVLNSTLKLLEKKARENGGNALYRELNALSDRLYKVSYGLQGSVLKTRMFPLRSVFHQFNRIVRDLSKEEGKDVELVLQGEDTELDKKVIDAIGEPLTHMVRNAVDHGIETPAERQKSGKPPRGRIVLSASQSGNRIMISVKDDGRGIDFSRVKTVAARRGLLAAESMETASNEDLLSFLMEPGFSTADRISAVSGRGVGLDVVNTVIGGLNGILEIRSEAGLGSEFTLTLPLTLAVSTVVLAEADGDLYGIPIRDIQESIKIPLAEIENRECVQAIRWRNGVLPVLSLARILRGGNTPVPSDSSGNVPIFVVSCRGRELGLAVDRILGKQEIVLKSLEEHFKPVRGLSGAAILGDGRVTLVIDILGIVQLYKELEASEMKKETAE